MVSFRNLFLSDSQRQVEAEARNIGLAHTIRDLITGSNHETHVDSYQKKQAVKALQKADPAQVNELIIILKAMPDPTVREFESVHNREHSKNNQHSEDIAIGPGEPAASKARVPSPSLPPPSSSPASGEGASSSVEDKDGGESGEKGDIGPDEIQPPSSWWAVSFASLMATFSTVPSSAEQPSVTTTTTTVTTVTLAEEEPGQVIEASEALTIKPVTETLSVTKDGSEATATATASATISEPKSESVGKGTITKTTTSSTTIASSATADKTVLVSTINSIKQQVLALTKAPPTHIISAYTYWWGYEIYVPHKCMSKLQRVTNTSQIFFGFLSGAVSGIPGLAALVPLSRIISAWVGFQWAVIHAEDLGKGVVLSATWVLPVALAPRPWDHPGTEEDPESVASPKSKQKRIKAT
ncbi:hypothetical protein EDD11_009064 [Mortierella claussenii]|nr:hypothetical protein EDD11_009064 [Mortierella claussenii]